MTARIQNTAPQPGITAGVQHLFKEVYSGGVPSQALELGPNPPGTVGGRLIVDTLRNGPMTISWMTFGMELP
jgi:hypothetical protein